METQKHWQHIQRPINKYYIGNNLWSQAVTLKFIQLPVSKSWFTVAAQQPTAASFPQLFTQTSFYLCQGTFSDNSTNYRPTTQIPRSVFQLRSYLSLCLVSVKGGQSTCVSWMNGLEVCLGHSSSTKANPPQTKQVETGSIGATILRFINLCWCAHTQLCWLKGTGP